MSIRLICVCGRSMSLPAKYAGEYVECPDCRAMLRIPTRDEDKELVRWSCKCGQHLKARPRSAGRKIHCPKCGMETMVPLPVRDDSFIRKKFSPKDSKGGADLAAPEKQKEPSRPTAGPQPTQTAVEEPAVLEPEEPPIQPAAPA